MFCLLNLCLFYSRPDIWFDDVDMDLIDQAEGKVKPAVKVTEKANPLVKAGSFDG